MHAEPGTTQSGAAFAVLGTVQVMLIFTITMLSVPLPVIASQFGLSRSGLVVLSTAYGLSFSGLLLLGGRLADRHGGRPIWRCGLLVFLSATAVAALAPGFAVLVAARFAQGAGAALVAPAALAMLPAVFPDARGRGRATATWGGLSVLGATLGIVSSGPATTWTSWRFTFAVPLVASAAALVLAPRLLPTAAPTMRRALDVPGAVLATAGFSLLGYGLALTSDRGWTSAAALVPVVAGLASLAAFALVESGRDDPLLPLTFIAERRRAVALLAIAMAATSTTVVYLFLALYLQQLRGWSPLRTSAAFAPAAAALVLGGRTAGRLLERYGARTVMSGGLALASGGLIALARINPRTAYAGGLLPGIVLLSIGAAWAFAGATVLTLRDLPQQQAGLGGGVMNTAMELGPTVGLALLTAVAGARTRSLDPAAVSPSAAMASGYAWSFGTAASGLAVLAALAAVCTARHPSIKGAHQ